MNLRSRALAVCLTAGCLGGILLTSAAQAAPKPAWEPIAASAPTNLAPAQSEIQRLAVDATEGTYTLTYIAASGMGKLSYGVALAPLSFFPTKEIKISNVSAGEFEVGQTITGSGVPAETELTECKPSCAAPTVLVISKTASFVVGNYTGRSKVVSNVAVEAGAFAEGQEVAGTGVPAGTTIVSCAPECAAPDSLTLSNFPTAPGTPTLSVSETTEAIPFDAPGPVVAAELNALPAIGAEGTSVSGGPGGEGATSPYLIAFDGGALADTDVAQLVPEDAELAGGVNGAAQVFTALDGGPGTAEVAIYPQNVGGQTSAGVTTIEFTLPPGVLTGGVPHGGGFFAPWACPGGAGESSMTCTRGFTNPQARPGLTLNPLIVPVFAAEGAESGNVHIEVSGGGAAGVATYEMPLVVSAIPAPIGLQAFTAGTYDEEGQIDTRAGAHPYSASSGFLINTRRGIAGEPVPSGEPRDIVVDTPPGFVGNPTAVPQCPEATEQEDCEPDTAVATVQIPLDRMGSRGEFAAVSSIQAPVGYPAKFRFITGNRQIVVNVVASLRSDEDYGLEIGSYDTPQIKPVMGAFFTIWGVPADAAHDSQRCMGFNLGPPCKTEEEILNDGGAKVAFLSNPVDCAEEAARTPKATVNVNTWQDPAFLFAGDVALEPVEKCEELDFEVDNFAFQPSTDDSDSPASFTTELEVPSAGLLDPEARMNPAIRETRLDLPEGVVLNASAADGLDACSLDEIGYKGNDFPRPNEIRFDREPNECPDASKIGGGELNSSLLADPLSADLFLAEQDEGNPFGSLFAIYLVVESEERGLNIKLPGEVRLDGGDGQQKIVFGDLPPLPFDSLELKLKGGDRSPLATPTTCGDYETKATNTPWSAPESGPPLTSPSKFEIDEGPGGGDCADSPGERPFEVGLRAGADSPLAGAFSPLSFQVTRPDGSQELDTLELAPPPGLAASLRGIPYCPEAAIAAAAGRDGEDEQDSPSCPAASRVGRALAGAGSGPRPFYAPGELYLAGPYKGAPLSIVAITPALAGPFDLGNVIARSAIHVNPVTAQVSAKTDPLPRVVKGVPLRIRDVRVILDRPGFSLNPSGCEEKAIGLRATGASGAVTNLAARFQVGACEALGFKPQMNLRLFGGVKRGAYQGLRAVVRPRPGDANISRTAVRMPRSAFLAQEHIRTVCTRVQFAADACPKGAIYGKAIAWSPLLDYPLRGNVYLRSSDNELPDVVADLRGPAHQPIKVEVVGRTDSVKGALRNTFDVVPDAPVSYFRLQLFGGQKGLIVNSRNICRGQNRAAVGLNAHNGRQTRLRPVLRNKRCATLRKKARKAAQRRASHSKRRGA